MSKKRTRTYLAIPLFMGVLALSQQVSADELGKSLDAEQPLVQETVVSLSAPEASLADIEGAEAIEAPVESPLVAGTVLPAAGGLAEPAKPETVNQTATTPAPVKTEEPASLEGVVATPETASLQPAVEVKAASSAGAVASAPKVHTFAYRTAVKAQPTVASPSLATYEVGERVIWDEKVENDGYEWLKYTNYRGGKNYVAVRRLPVQPTVVSRPTAPVQPATSSRPTAPAQPAVVSRPTASVQPTAAPATTSASVAETQPKIHTFAYRTAVKAQPTVASPSLATYEVGERVIWDEKVENDGYEWLKYTNYRGGKNYVAVRRLPVQPTVVSRPTATVQPATSSRPTAPAQPAVVSRPTATVQPTAAPAPAAETQPKIHTFAYRTAVKAQPTVASPSLATYEVGERVIWDEKVENDGYEWLKYTNYAGGKNYVAIRRLPVTAAPVASRPATPVPSSNGRSASQGNYNVLNKVIYLDAGHGGADPGAVYGAREKDLNLAVQNLVKAGLEKENYRVVLTRSDDQGMGLTERSQKANASDADLFVSIHFNASVNSSARGIETYYYQSYPEYPARLNPYHENDQRHARSAYLAQAIHSEVLGATKAVDNGVRRNTFAVLRETVAPSVLLELGYMSNPTEAKQLVQKSYQEKLAQGIVKGILSYYKRFL